MKISFLAITALVSSLAAPGASAVEIYSVFKAAVLVPVDQVIVGQEIDKIVTRKLTAKEVINLSLGRPIDTAINVKEEILAVAMAFESPTQIGQPPPAPHTKLIIWNPTKLGPQRIVKVVGELTDLDFDQAYGNSGIKGQGVATASVAEGTGDNKFFAFKLRGAARVSQPYSKTMNQIDSSSTLLTGLGGRVSYQYTDKNNPTPVVVNGMVVKGTLTTVGKVLATYQE